MIVVLGAPVGRGGAPSDAMMRRIEHAVALWKAGAAPWLMLCGGHGEAEAMQRVARAAGVPETAMLLDTRSTSTFENAREAARLMREHALAAALLVTEAYHLPRARMLFRLHRVPIAGVSAARGGSLGYRLAMAAREILTIPANIRRVATLRHRRP